MTAGTWRSRFLRVPAPVVDAGLAVALTAAVTTAIRFAPEQGGPPRAAAYLLGFVIGALAVFRRRWPLAVLLASAAALLFYNLLDNPGIFAAVPLSVAMATAWAAGRRLWALLIAVWFSVTPVFFVMLTDLPEAMSTQVLYGVVSDMALMAAVLLLGEAIRGRRALKREQERSEALLLNVLPPSIADRLKEGEQVIADGLPDVTVMFADLVDFTHISRGIGPDQVVEELNDLFSAFDGLARLHGLEKIKTIGDAYMVAGGLPGPRPDHTEAVAEMALALREEVAGRVDPDGRPLEIRIGIDTGPVVAGIIGRDKFSYDLWGDTVNTASRMESHGVPGSIQVTERTYLRLRDAYRFERRGSIQVKGKGEMVTWFLLGGNQTA
ncbi:MAG: adenylate/guanylate cyclase domain-containing protein [Acidimicrobiia bacterium]